MIHKYLFNIEQVETACQQVFWKTKSVAYTTVCFYPNPSCLRTDDSGCLPRIRFKFWCRHTDESVHCVRLLLFTWRSRPTCKQGHNHSSNTVFCDSWLRLQHAKVILIAHTYVYAPISSMIHGQATWASVLYSSCGGYTWSAFSRADLFRDWTRHCHQWRTTSLLLQPPPPPPMHQV